MCQDYFEYVTLYSIFGGMGDGLGWRVANGFGRQCVQGVQEVVDGGEGSAENGEAKGEGDVVLKLSRFLRSRQLDLAKTLELCCALNARQSIVATVPARIVMKRLSMVQLSTQS